MPAKHPLTETRLAHLCCRLMTRRSAGTRAMRVATLLAALPLALLAAGCGGDDPSATSTATATPTSTATAESSGATPTSTVTPTSAAAASEATPTAAPSTATPASTPTETSTPTTPSPTPTPRPTLTIEEYAEWCGWEDVEPDAGEVTAFETVAEDLTELLLIEPPPELSGFHDAIVRTGSVMLLFLDDTEGGGDQGDEEDALLWALLLVLLARDIEREAEVLPGAVRSTLQEAGCLLDEELSETLASATPTPTAVAREEPRQGVPNGPPSWDTLELVIARGELKCGVKQTQSLFGWRERDGTVSGFEIEFCKAIAAAVLGDSRRVHYIDASDAATRFYLLADAEIDVLIRTTTFTASRDRELEVDFAQPIFYTGQGFAVRKDSGIASTSDMGDAAICVQTGTTLEQNVADHFTDIGLLYDPQGGLSQDVAEAFFSGRCDVLTEDASNLASRIAVRDDANDYKILPQIISKEPLAPAVRDYDSEWKDIVNWVVHGLIAAEELGITQANVGRTAANPPNTMIARLLGVPFDIDYVATLGFDRIDPQFIQRAIAAVGNYGEIYERTVGDYIPRSCTLNDLVINNAGCPDGQGGIMYAFPYR